MTPQTFAAMVALWVIECNAKCADCAKGLDLGAHGCHFEGDGEESYSTGNCKAWPLSKRIKEAAAMEARLRGLVAEWPHDQTYIGEDWPGRYAHSENCKRCAVEQILGAEGSGKVRDGE